MLSPFLIILAIWRYGFSKIKFEYSPFYWSVVFPLGMYAACTIKLSQAIQIPFVMNIPKYFIYVVFVAWVFIFVNMIISILKSVREKLELKEHVSPLLANIKEIRKATLLNKYAKI